MDSDYLKWRIRRFFKISEKKVEQKYRVGDYKRSSHQVTDAIEDKVLNHLFRKTEYGSSNGHYKIVEGQVTPTFYVGLCSSINDGSICGEPQWESYRRVEVTKDDFTDGSNNRSITFPEAQSDWGMLSHAFITDKPELGYKRAIIEVPLSVPRCVSPGDTPSFRRGDLWLSLHKA